jgi:hypothetical protein
LQVAQLLFFGNFCFWRKAAVHIVEKVNCEHRVD